MIKSATSLMNGTQFSTLMLESMIPKDLKNITLQPATF
jgi:hypothetical protein